MEWHSMIKPGFIWLSPTTITGVTKISKNIYLEIFQLGTNTKPNELIT